MSDDSISEFDRLKKNLSLVAFYMNELHERLLALPLFMNHDREKRILALYQRSLAWIRTLTVLDKTTYLQAIVASTRALLETTIDIVLMHHDKTTNSSEKMEAWEESGKLKAAQALISYFRRSKKPIPDLYSQLVSFVDKNQSIILNERNIHWPCTKGKHPERWTGSSSLLDDIRIVDKSEKSIFEIELGFCLEEFYEAMFRPLCWNIHGSALGGIRGLNANGFHSIICTSYKWSSDLSMLGAKYVIAEIGQPQFLQEWDVVNKERTGSETGLYRGITCS